MLHGHSGSNLASHLIQSGDNSRHFCPLMSLCQIRLDHPFSAEVLRYLPQRRDSRRRRTLSWRSHRSRLPERLEPGACEVQRQIHVPEWWCVPAHKVSRRRADIHIIANLFVLQVHQANNNGDPVKHVRKHGPHCKDGNESSVSTV